ncbi:Hypothetical predicted protein, partial [Pelobates cultripes]
NGSKYRSLSHCLTHSTILESKLSKALLKSRCSTILSFNMVSITFPTTETTWACDHLSFCLSSVLDENSWLGYQMFVHKRCCGLIIFGLSGVSMDTFLTSLRMRTTEQNLTLLGRNVDAEECQKGRNLLPASYPEEGRCQRQIPLTTLDTFSLTPTTFPPTGQTSGREYVIRIINAYTCICLERRSESDIRGLTRERNRSHVLNVENVLGNIQLLSFIRIHTQERNHSHVLNVENVLSLNQNLLFIREPTQKRNRSHVLNVENVLSPKYILFIIREPTQERNRSHVLNVENVLSPKRILFVIREPTQERNCSHVLNVENVLGNIQLLSFIRIHTQERNRSHVLNVENVLGNIQLFLSVIRELTQERN